MILEKFLRFQLKHAKILFLLILLFIGTMGYIGKDLKIETDFSTLVPEDTEFNTNSRILKNSFETTDGVVVLLKLSENTKLDSAIKTLDDKRVTQYFEDVKSVAGESSLVTRVGEVEFSDDKRYARLNIAVSTPDKVGGFQDVLKQVNTLISEVGVPVGTQVEVTGFPVLLDRVSQLLITDNLNTILITFIFIFLILFWYSRDVYMTLVAMTTPIMSLVTLAALMVILDLSVTITLAAVGVLILGLGVDYSIHITVYYRKVRRLYKDHIQAMIATINHLKIAITASFITTLAGFTALIYGVSPSSQAQGTVLGIGIVIIYLISFLMYPVILTVFEKRIKTHPNASFRKVVNYLAKLAIYQTRKPKTVIAIIAILTVVMMFGASQVQFSTSNSNWIPENDPISQSFRELNSVYGNVDSITLVVHSTKGDLRNVQTARDLEILRSQLEGISNVDSVTSPYKNLEYNSASLHNNLTSNEALRSQFNNDYTLTTLSVRSENLGQDDAGNSVVLKDLREILGKSPIHNAKISLTGDPVRFEELGGLLEADAGLTTIISLALVFLVASLVYASVKIGFMALLPIIIAVIWAVGLMGYFRVPFTTLSTSIISLVLGVGVDFSIHLVDSIKNYLKKMDLEKAITQSLTTSGAAILLSSITTFAGFMALTFAQLLGTQRLGFSLAFSMVAVFIVSITLVPAMISVSHKENNEGSKLKKKK